MKEKKENKGVSSLVNTLKISFSILRVVIFLVLVLIIFSGTFYVREGEQAMILRFGKAVGNELIESGAWHWAWPEPIDKVIRIPSKRNMSVVSDVFWHADELIEEDQSLLPGRDGYLLTADMNIIHLKTSAVCEIVDPLKYYFRMVDEQRGILLKNLLNQATLQATSTLNVDDTLYRNVDLLQNRIKQFFMFNLGVLDFGIGVVDIKVDYKTPPLAVVSSFSEVANAEQSKAMLITQARSYYDEKINQAHGKASEVIARANLYKQKSVAELEASSKYFEAIRGQYILDKRSTILSIYNESLSQAIKLAQERFILPSRGNGERELRIMLGRESEEKVRD